ncbi:MAG: ABC transporter ATP-binding protein [Candidatus Marinimicrobia bacterium]|nr:ABC transporter ATP-binding protein [Candidatus Neomarinimicrobiota bacterium]MBL7009691.1 ABC transporter ATP-binding protein [Candidatus Neomarinimicrobiota bacterium]MBL7029566.1 ABC transporter ATP-binding protein [Candidatus Neomarinimicrobiota bacterium]
MSGLNLKNVRMQFSGVVALDDVSFNVDEGEIFSLIGPNGSGKSTLFNCINRFNDPQNGVINFNGQNLLKMQSHQIMDAGISRTFQNIQNVPFMTILDNILLGAHHRIDNRSTVKRWLSRKQRQEEEAMGLEILDFLGIANYEGKYMIGQPYGIQKLTEIARALVAKPKLILMDEPAAGMNDQETYEIGKIITEIRDDLDITVLVVEHDMSLVMSISDRICVLDSGIILAIGEPEEVKNHPEVIKAFLGDSGNA